MPAFNKTRLQIINEVEQRLREAPSATSSSTLYSTFLAKLLNSVKTEIEQSWSWLNLRDTYTINTQSGTSSYTLTSSGQYAQILDIWNITTGQELQRSNFYDMNRKFFGAPNGPQTGAPTQYLPAGHDGNLDLTIDVWPVPTATTNSLRANVYAPQKDPTDDATVLVVPAQILIEGMVAYAMAERGDDSGTAAQAQQQYYRALLAGAVATEGGHDAYEQDWHPV